MRAMTVGQPSAPAAAQRADCGAGSRSMMTGGAAIAAAAFSAAAKSRSVSSAIQRQGQ